LQCLHESDDHDSECRRQIEETRRPYTRCGNYDDDADNVDDVDMPPLQPQGAPQTINLVSLIPIFHTKYVKLTEVALRRGSRCPSVGPGPEKHRLDKYMPQSK